MAQWSHRDGGQRGQTPEGFAGKEASVSLNNTFMSGRLYNFLHCRSKSKTLNICSKERLLYLDKKICYFAFVVSYMNVIIQ